MNALKRMMSFVTGGKNTPPPVEDVLPRCVQRMYIQEKDAGHRGPVVGSFLVKTVDDQVEVVVSVTPSGVIVVSSEFGGVLSNVRPELGDAFTCAIMVPIARPTEEAPRAGGLVVGTQNGTILLIEISIESEQRIVAHCVANSGISSLSGTASLIFAGTVDGKILVWDPMTHPLTPSVSIHASDETSDSSVSALLSFQNDQGATLVWASVDEVGIQVFELAPGPSLIRSNAIAFEGMHVITNMVLAIEHDLVICLSSCSEVYLIDRSTGELGQQYPASLMTCGVAMTSLTLEKNWLFLGGVDGSLCVRELSKREKDGKLQCVLLKCFQTLKPSSDEANVNSVEGCPITSISCCDSETCVVGDASCCVFVVKINTAPIIERQNTETPPSLCSKDPRGSVDSFDLVSDKRGSVDDNILPDDDEVQRQITSFRRVSQPEETDEPEKEEALPEESHKDIADEPEQAHEEPAQSEEDTPNEAVLKETNSSPVD